MLTSVRGNRVERLRILDDFGLGKSCSADGALEDCFRDGGSEYGHRVDRGGSGVKWYVMNFGS